MLHEVGGRQPGQGLILCRVNRGLGSTLFALQKQRRRSAKSQAGPEV